MWSCCAQLKSVELWDNVIHISGVNVLKDEALKIRVPRALRRHFQVLAAQRMTSESELYREALIEYCDTRGLKLPGRQAPPRRPNVKSLGGGGSSAPAGGRAVMLSLVSRE